MSEGRPAFHQLFEHIYQHIDDKTRQSLQI